MSKKDRISRRRFLTATGGATSAAIVAGCLGGDDPSEDGDGGDGGTGDGNETTDDGGDDGSEPADPGELNLINSTMSSLDPIQSTDTASSQVIDQMYETLTYYPNGETEVENQLAAGYEISDDLLTYTFELEEAEFHDGDPLTAQDFVYSWRRLAESQNSERRNFILEDTFLAVDHETETQENDEGEEVEVTVPDSIAVEAVDERTLEVNLQVPNANALELMAYNAFAAVPEGIVGDIEGYDGDIEHGAFSTEEAIGTGPFEFDTWEPDAEARVTKFDNYWGDEAQIDAVHWQIIEDDDAAFTYAMEQSADVFGIPTAQYDPDLVDAEEDDQGRMIGTYGPMENDETANYVGVNDITVFYVAFNAQHVPLPVRQAISYVTHREELITEVFKERGQEAWTFTPPAIWPDDEVPYDEFIQDYPYSRNETDRDGAQQVLEEAGYTEDDPFELTLTTYESEVFQEFGRLTRDKLSGLGIELELEQAPFSTLIERGMNGDLEFYSLGWTWSWPEADYGLFGFAPENTRTGEPMQTGEATGYYLDWHAEDSDAMQQAQEAWEQVEANPEPEEGQAARNEAYVQMERAIWDDAILLPLYHPLTERFHYDYVDIEPFGAMGEYLQRFNHVTIEDSE